MIEQEIEELKLNKIKFISKIPDKDKIYLFRAIFLSITIRIALLVVAYFVGRGIPKYNTNILEFIYQAMAKWDAKPFLFLAQYGYTDIGIERTYLVYFPLYPALVYILHYIFITYMTAALFISFTGSVISGYLIQKLVAFDFDETIVKKTLWFFFLFPTAYFLVVPYTEPVFIPLVLASFFFARKKKWFLASLMAMLCTATRLQGLVMIPTLMIEFWFQRKETDLKKILWLGIIPLGFLTYLYINWYVAHNVFEFLKIQREHFYHENITPWYGIWDTIKHIWVDKADEVRATIYETRLWAIIIASGLLLASVKKLRLSYSFYSWSQLLILLTDSWLMSMPRYIFVFFPIFISLALISKKEYVYQFLILISSLTMVGFFSLYAAGNWAF